MTREETIQLHSQLSMAYELMTGDYDHDEAGRMAQARARGKAIAILGGAIAGLTYEVERARAPIIIERGALLIGPS